MSEELVRGQDGGTAGSGGTVEGPMGSHKELRIAHPEDGLEHRIEGVYLGRITDADGRNAGYRDSVTSPVPGANFGLVVSQASYGFTGISARQEPGYRVEVGEVDSDTAEITWSGPKEGSDTVRVTGDWGNMGAIPPDQWTDDNIANPGVRGGIVRVTQEGAEGMLPRYYAVGADFRGEPDSWHVSGGVAEVTLREEVTQPLPSAQPAALPPAPEQ